jgi:hypothetical protein
MGDVDIKGKPPKSSPRALRCAKETDQLYVSYHYIFL